MEPGFAAGESDWTGRLAGTPFAAALAEGAPLLIAYGDPPQAAFATASALAAFGVRDARALSGLLFIDDPVLGPRRWARLAVETPPEAPPRLEPLRQVNLQKPLSAAWLCGRIERDGESFFVAADVAPTAKSAPRTPQTLAPQTPAPQTPAPEPPAPQRLAPEPPAAEMPTRFVWRLDAEERFAAPDPALRESLGASAPHEGEALDALSARVGLDSALSARIAERQTFTRLDLIWPEPDRERGRPVKLSGAPAYGADRAYDGFAGFGLIANASVALPAPLRAAPKPPPAPRREPLAGDAAALLNLLQRQHGATPLAAAPGDGPALAIISALAALLELKPSRPSPPVSPAKPAPPKPQGGAEIVRLRPNAAPDAPAFTRTQNEGDSVALTSEERDAFKEIARALGVNVRAGRNAAPEPPPRAEPEPLAGPSENDLAALLDILPVAVLVTRGGAPLFANKTLLDLAGYDSFDDFRDRDGVKAIFRGRDPQSLAPGGGVAAIPLAVGGDRTLTVDALFRPAVWRGAPAELVAMRRSRDAEHQAELRAFERDTAMHAARARDLSAALEAARDGMVRLDRNGRILGLNRGAERLFGYDQKEMAGDSVQTLLAPPSHGAVAAALEKLSQSEAGALEPVDAVARGQDGRQFPVRLDLGRLANAPEPDYFALVTVAAEPAAKAAEPEPSTAKVEILSRVSHDLRTPLTAIIGFAEAILDERFGPIGADRYREYAREIHTTGRQILSLANDLTDLTKLDLGRADLQFAPVDVNVVVRDCIALMQPQAARERVIVRLSLYDRLPKILADAHSVRRILLNLIANAVKFNEPGGQVIVSTAVDEGGQVLLRVRDTGVGMSESELASALEPYNLANAEKGEGLGLPIAKALVEANHADFSIRSRRAQGTLVEIAFPVLQAAQ